MALLLVALVFTPPPPPFVEANSPPAAPGAVTVTRADGTITASGYAVSNATKYHITYSTDNGKSWHAPVEGHTNITTRSLTFKADNAKSYIVGVRAGNAHGWSDWRNSPPVGPYTPPKPTPTPTPTPAPTPAPAPTLTAARSNDGNTASVSWTAYTGEEFQYYRVIVCDDSQYDGASCSGTVFKSDPIYDASSTGPITVTGLNAGTGYGVILQVWRGGSALKIHATLPAVPVVGPNAPANLSVTPGDGYLDIAWDAVTGATGYDVRAKKAGSSSWHSVASNVTGVSHRYTTTETMDYVAVRARNASGPGNWAEISRMPSNNWLSTVQQSGASAQSAQGQNKLAAPTWGTITRDNGWPKHKLHLNWTAVSGATGYNVACSDLNGWNWWSCGAVTSGTTTSLTIDKDTRSNKDLGRYRPYKLSIRAVTGDPAQASDWTESENINPVSGHLLNLVATRSNGSITLTWTPTAWTTGYLFDCAVVTGANPAYTRCATLPNQVDTAAEHSVTISTWTAGGTNYSIDNTKSYDIKIISTNKWGQARIIAPVLDPYTTAARLTAGSLATTGATLTVNNYGRRLVVQAHQPNWRQHLPPRRVWDDGCAERPDRQHVVHLQGIRQDRLQQRG